MIILLTHQGKPHSTWGSLTRCCRELDLPYHYLKKQKFPFEWKDWHFKKIQHNGK